jgi:uncharacterized protein (TIGR02271 family)
MQANAAQQWIGYPVIDRDGKDLGEVTKILVDDETGKPEWAVISMGILGGEKPVPIANASTRGEQLQANVTKDQVKKAPGVAHSDHLTPEEEIALFDHYGVPYGGDTVTSMDGARTTSGQAANGDRISLHEEELVAKKQTVQQGEARVGKQVVTQERQIEVPVTHEEAYIERTPVRARPAEGQIGEGELRVPLMAEQATADKRTVVKEEVKLGKRPVQETQQVSDTIRREEPTIQGGTLTDQQGQL